MQVSEAVIMKMMVRMRRMMAISSEAQTHFPAHMVMGKSNILAAHACLVLQGQHEREFLTSGPSFLGHGCGGQAHQR